MFQVQTDNGDWVEVGKPDEGQRYKLYDGGGGVLESVWKDPIEFLQIVITKPSANRSVLVVGSGIEIDIEIRSAVGDVLPITDTFAVPIRRIGGAVERTVGISFTDGVASKTINWPSSGEFEITEDLINMHLPPEQHFKFERLVFSVYE